MRKRALQKQNASVFEGNAGKNIKEIHTHLNGLTNQIDKAQEKLGQILKDERSKIWEELDKKLVDIKEMFRKEAEKKKDSQYDYKQKEKELNEHLETMTQVAQDVDDKNRLLTKQNQELNIQYLSQENDRDLLIRQLIYQKKESAKLREQHHKLKKQVDIIKEADKADEQELRFNQERHGQKPTTAATGKRDASMTKNGLKHIPENPGIKRPNTTAIGNPQRANARPFTVNTQFGGMTNFGFGKSIGGRGLSANFADLNPKLRKYENLICRTKKILDAEKSKLRQVKTLTAKEIEQKNFLEKILRQCVDDVKNEIQKKRTEGKVQYYQKAGGGGLGYGFRQPKKNNGMEFDDRNLTKAEREKILEVLLSQERVLTLLYDKTFPPRQSSQTLAVGGARGLLGASLKHQKHSKSMKGLSMSHAAEKESMRQFNYYG